MMRTIVALGLVVLALVVAYGWFTEGPRSFRAQFERDAAAGLTRHGAAAVVTDQDLAALPAPLQRYLLAAGVVGQPRVQNYRLRFTGRIRSGPDAAWMPFEAEQQSFSDPPTRLFLMRARMRGVPRGLRTAIARLSPPSSSGTTVYSPTSSPMTARARHRKASSLMVSST